MMDCDFDVVLLGGGGWLAGYALRPPSESPPGRGRMEIASPSRSEGGGYAVVMGLNKKGTLPLRGEWERRPGDTIFRGGILFYTRLGGMV